MESSFPRVMHCSDMVGAEAIIIIDYIPPMEALLADATEADLRAVAEFAAESRRRERLAWRAMLRRALGRECVIEYKPSGKPQIVDEKYSHISVSHCRDMVAVALSTRECGVDVELLERRFAAVAERYMSHEELAMATTAGQQAIVWSAKEVLYKMAGTEGLDLRGEIRITQIDEAEARVRGVVEHRGERLMEQSLHYCYPDAEHILIYGL